MAMTADQAKKGFEKRGEIVKDWAQQNGFKPQAVVSVLNGFNKGRRGTAYQIAVALGIKDPSDSKGANA